MSRRDLISKSENPWSKYLLAEKVMEESETSFERGRYKGMNEATSKQSKLKQELANIEMLDSKLFTVSKKAKDVNIAISLLSHDFDNTSPRANSAKFDSTFLTKFKIDTDRTSRQSTARKTNRFIIYIVYYILCYIIYYIISQRSFVLA